MEMSIRSQDKLTLTKYNNNIKIIETKNLKEKLEKSLLSMLSDMEQMQSYLKDGWSIIVDDINMGVYLTKERALEVLDEIQNILKPTIIIKYEYDDSQPIMNGEWLKSLKEESKIEELSNYVYEMPKE